jgi:anti-sigma regulatory factor (Ser/Thr protein kinase)
MTMSVRCDRAAPSAVRAWLCELDGLNWVLGDVMLVASELVTNAVRQAGESGEGWIEVSVSQRDSGILIRVSDPGPAGDAERPVGDLEADEGLGLRLVEALTRRWGVLRGAPHTVWVEV